MRALAGLLLCCAALGYGQDEQRVVSPNGQIEFRIFITAQPDDAGVTRLAYRILRRGAPVIETSFLAIDILNQEPMLGENLGMMAKSAGSPGDGKYRSLLVDYMQNGSLGRRLNVEARVYDDGVAFRYIIPKSTALEELVIHDEATEFSFPHAGTGPLETLPVAVRQPGDWVGITEIAEPGFPAMRLIQSSESVLTARLAKEKSDRDVAWEGASPLIWPWRVVVIGFDPDHPARSAILSDLGASGHSR